MKLGTKTRILKQTLAGNWENLNIETGIHDKDFLRYGKDFSSKIRYRGLMEEEQASSTGVQEKLEFRSMKSNDSARLKILEKYPSLV